MTEKYLDEIEQMLRQAEMIHTPDNSSVVDDWVKLERDPNEIFVEKHRGGCGPTVEIATKDAQRLLELDKHTRVIHLLTVKMKYPGFENIPSGHSVGYKSYLSFGMNKQDAFKLLKKLETLGVQIDELRTITKNGHRNGEFLL